MAELSRVILSLIHIFFEPESDKSIFEDLEIGRDRELCEKYMGKFPVISVSLKGINADSYEKACRMAAQIINGEARRLQYLLESPQLTQYDKDAFSVLLRDDMDEPSLCYSLKTLSELLQKHHDSKVILLIDEYDVPLAKAFEQGFYDKMVLLIRNLFEQVLKRCV